MPCPFCHSLLTKYEAEFHIGYDCDNNDCIQDNMSRYHLVIFNGEVITKSIMYPGIYVQIDYKNHVTVISRLQACFLTDSIRIPRPLDFNHEEPDALLHKIKTIITFS